MVVAVNDVVKTLLGDYEIRAEEIKPDEWFGIFKGFLKRVDLERFKFANVRTLHGVNTGLQRHMSTSVFRDVKEKTGLYMRIADIDSPPFSSKDFPLSKPGAHDHDRLPVMQHTLLMTRKSEFVQMRAQWAFEIVYDQYDRPILEQARLMNISLEPICERDVVELIRLFPGLPAMMIQSLIICLAEVVPDMESDLIRHREARAQLERVARVSWQLHD